MKQAEAMRPRETRRTTGQTARLSEVATAVAADAQTRGHPPRQLGAVTRGADANTSHPPGAATLEAEQDRHHGAAKARR